MEQLTALDALSLKTERIATPQHITQVFIYDPSTTTTEVVRFKAILDHYRNRQDLSPIFRRKLVRVPLDLDNPYLVISDNVDFEYHILHSQSIDTTRPMWQVYVIEGLDNVEGFPKGAFAILTKLHHAVADGRAALEMLEAIHDPSPGLADGPHEALSHESEPSTLRLLIKAGKNSALQPWKSTAKVSDIIQSMRRKSSFRKQHGAANLKQNEKTIFNHGIKSPHRVWGAGLFNIAEALTIKKKMPGATLNDVILCITSFAVERYLEKHEANIKESLIAGVAVNTREISKHKSGQNHATGIAVSVYSNIKDPVKRLQAISSETVLRKEQMLHQGVDLMSDVLEAIPSQLLALSFYSADRLNLLNEQNMGFHYMTTNIPGPRTPRYMVGAKVIAGFGMAPLLGTTGLTFVITSYCDKLAISFTSVRDCVKDPDYLERCVYDAFDTVRDAVL